MTKFRDVNLGIFFSFMWLHEILYWRKKKKLRWSFEYIMISVLFFEVIYEFFWCIDFLSLSDK